MNQTLINNWNSRVNPEDVVYVLGDFCFGGKAFLEEVLSQLNGNIVFIKGNHDKNSLTNIQSMIIRWQGTTIEMVHRPEDATFTADITCHGHLHLSSCDKPLNMRGDYKLYNVNCEFHGYGPKLINEIIGECKK